MIDENASYIGATIQDQESIDAYERIGETLREQETPDDFMGIITTTMIFLPHLICLDNLLYIIDDRHVRPANLVGISGRDLLDYQISIGEKLNEYPEAMIDYYREKYDLERGVSESYPEDSELACTLWTLHHALVLSYELRNYVSMINKMKYQFRQNLQKKPAHTQAPEQTQLMAETKSKSKARDIYGGDYANHRNEESQKLSPSIEGESESESGHNDRGEYTDSDSENLVSSDQIVSPVTESPVASSASSEKFAF